MAKQWTHLKAYNTQSQAVEAVRKWQLQQLDDASTLRAIELLYDLSIVLVVGSGRTVSGCLPAMLNTGGSRKNIWSAVYIDKAREYRTLTDLVSMWQREYSKERILKRLSDTPSLTVVGRIAPTVSCDHVAWRQWIAFVCARTALKRKELHGCWRAQAREAMLGAIKSRSDNYLKGSQRSAISSWLDRARRAPPNEINPGRIQNREHHHHRPTSAQKHSGRFSEESLWGIRSIHLVCRTSPGLSHSRRQSAQNQHCRTGNHRYRLARDT